jgi:sortase A
MLQSKISLTIFFLAIGLFFQGFYTKPPLSAGSNFPQNIVDNNAVGFVEDTTSPGQTSFGLPVRLKIPDINVNADIKYTGFASDGVMDAPNGPDDVVWFEFGPRPGDGGSAVIAGHYGHWKNGGGSVFDDLSKLKPGDKIYVEDEKGATIVFVARENRSYDPDEDASDVFNSNDGKPHLNLITCEGVWDKISESYSERLVVFADKE